MSSKVFGDETYKVRNEVSLIEFDDDWYVAINGLQCIPMKNF